MSTSMPTMTERSGYLLEVLRDGADFAPHRWQHHGNPFAGPFGGANCRTAAA